MRPVRTGVIGFGWFFELLLDRVIADVTDLEVVAAADLSRERRDAAQARGIAVFADIGEMLDATQCEAVMVLTPHDTHRAAVEHAAAAGRHVFCEKAMAVTAADCVAMIDATRRAGVELVVGHMQKLFPPYARVVALARSGVYGDVLAVDVQGFHWSPVFEGWWRSADRCGGLLYWTGIHDLDTMRAIVGSEVREVYAAAAPKREAYTAYDDHVAATVRYENGAVGTIQVACHEPLRAFEQSFGTTVLCARGGIRYLPEHGVVEHAPRSGLERGAAQSEHFGSAEEIENAAYRAELEHFARVVRGLEPARLTGEDGLRCVETLEAITRSLRSGRPEPVSRHDVG